MSLKDWAKGGEGIPKDVTIAPGVVLPKKHRPAMFVPAKGASCATCKHNHGPDCDEPHFQKYNGGPKIPGGDPKLFCSDWYEPRE